MNEIKENSLHISWHDSTWIPGLNQNNVLEYFSERSNPFYDRTCNNEIVKMQRLSLDQLNNMQGIEYILLHVQEPILYVIRKQHRLSPSQVTPISDYYILAGVVYQAPDLNSLINSRILAAVHHLQSAFEEAHSFARYHPSKGYWWEFNKESDKESRDKLEKLSKDAKAKEETTSTKFQRKRVDVLLSELAKKFPPKIAPLIQQQQTAADNKAITQNATTNNDSENKADKNSEANCATTALPATNANTVASANSATPQVAERTKVANFGGPPEKKSRLN